MTESEVYECALCGFKGRWDISYDVHGDMWGCEECGIVFCSKCFKDKFGTDAWMLMTNCCPIILCPECFEKRQHEKWQGRKGGCKQR